MGRRKINDTKLLQLVDGGRSFVEIGKVFGVSTQAAHKRFKELRGKTTGVVVAKKVEQIVDRKIDAMEQLQKVNDYANELLDLLMRWNRGDEEALQVLESQVRKVRVRGSEEEVTNYKFKDPRELALKAMAEIRGQLSLQLDIFQALFSLQAAKDFEETVLEVIGEVDPNVRNEIINRLNRKRSVRQAVRFT
jgi:DNA-binding Lrp family transcriptional regulator